MNTRLAALVDDLYLFKMKYFQMPTSSNYLTSVKFAELILTQAIKRNLLSIVHITENKNNQSLWIDQNTYLVVSPRIELGSKV